MSGDERPTDIPEGYLGPQAKFGELQMECVSHRDPEFTLHQDNEVEIKFRVPVPVKTTCNLIEARTDQDYPQYVFTQTLDNVVSFVLSFPESGWYKFQVFALSTQDPSKSLPNVCNYLVHVRRALKAVYTYPKQFAPWRNGCYLFSPLILNSSSRLRDVQFKVSILNAKDVAVVTEKEWTHLKNTSGSIWEGKVSVDQHRNKGVTVSLSACFSAEDDCKFATLLEYTV